MKQKFKSFFWVISWGLIFLWAYSASVEKLFAGPVESLVEKPIEKKSKILYPKKTELKFDGTQIQGEIQNPGEFYFQHKSEEKFESLIQRRKNFHREMLRDVVFSK